MIIYSLLSAQNVWINSCECFGLREVQKSTCTYSMHEFELLIHRWGLVGILICHWSTYKWKHNSFYKMFMAAFIFYILFSSFLFCPSWQSSVLLIVCLNLEIIHKIIDYASLDQFRRCRLVDIHLLHREPEVEKTDDSVWSGASPGGFVLVKTGFQRPVLGKQTSAHHLTAQGCCFLKKTNQGSDCPLNDTHRLEWCSHCLGL